MGKKFDEKWWGSEKRKLEEKYGVSFSNEEGARETRFISRDYINYLRGQKLETNNWYISLCRLFKNIAKVPVGKQIKEKLTNAIDLLDWDITPEQCLAVASIISIVFAVPALVLLILPLPLVFKLIVGAIPFGVFFYLLNFTHLKVLEKVLRSSEDLIFSVLYMVIYTYASPNMEGAVLFAAMNLDGPISHDLKKVIWDVEIGRYASLEESLGDYVSRWEPYNKDFLQAIQMVRAAMLETSNERRINYLNAASNTILLGTREKMKHYSQELKMPVMMLNGLGILLPILGMISFPIISMFLKNSIELYHIVLFYNLIIPGLVYFFMASILVKRPPTTSVRAINSHHITPPGKISFTVGGRVRNFPVAIFSWLVFVVFSAPAAVFYVTNGFNNIDPSFGALAQSMMFVAGVGLGLATQYYFGHRKRLEKQIEIKEIEREFPTALFEVGHRLLEGKPVEVGLDGAIKSMRRLKIANFFRIISSNIVQAGMTFQEAVFDKRYGALMRFPSKLIETVMKAVVEASHKGTKIASNTMMTIASYLRNLHTTQEEIKDLMEETTTTMKFIGYVLAPVIAGVAVSMTQIMGSALKVLSERLSELSQIGQGAAGAVNFESFLSGLLDFKEIISPDLLQIVIGIYVIEILLIVGIFYSRITEGLNRDYERVFTSKLLLVGIIIYAITALVIAMLFGGLIESFI